MHTIIADYSNSFEQLKILQPDGTLIKTTATEKEGVRYWVKTPTGEIVEAWGSDGLNKLLGFISILRSEERDSISSTLLKILELNLEQCEVEIDFRNKTPIYFLNYNEENSAFQKIFTDFDELLGFLPGYP